jgi:hypothetical protein
MGALHRFYQEIWRVRWALVISVAVLVLKAYGWLPPGHPLAVILTKASNVTLGFILAHILRQQTFPYIDLKVMLAAKDPAFGYTFIGIALLYGSIIYAVALGL